MLRSAPPLRIFDKLDNVPVIHTAADLQPVWDAFLREFIPLQGPLIPALSRVLRAVDVVDTLVAAGIFSENEIRDWHADEALRYCVRHLYATDRPLGGLLRDSTDADAEFGRQTFMFLGSMSLVRDYIEAVRLGFCTVDIDSGRGLVRFKDLPDMVSEIERREFKSIWKEARRQQLTSLDRDIVADEVAAVLEALKAEVDQPQLVFGSAVHEERITKLFLQLSDLADEPPSLWLPDETDFGCYTAGQFRKFSDFLWALARMHELLMKRLIEVLPSLPVFLPPHNAALMISQSEYMIDQAVRLTGLSQAVAAEILKDLTFSVEAYNPSPFIHPFLPIGGGRVLTIPRLLLGSNWVGALLRILERVPWRAEARRRFGERREALMQDVLESGIKSLGSEARRNIKVGPRAARIGDIDLLLFRKDDARGLALSLKWYYPPNLVQEVASQTSRLREAVQRHASVVAAFRADYAQISRSYNLPPHVEFRPVLVAHPGPVFDRARSADIPTLTGSEFLDLAGRSSSLGELIEKIESYEAPRIRIQQTRNRRIFLGRYTFELPDYHIPESEIDRLRRSGDG